MEYSERKPLEKWTDEDMGRVVYIHVNYYISPTDKAGEFLNTFPENVKSAFWKSFKEKEKSLDKESLEFALSKK